MILTSEQRAEHQFAGQNTQQTVEVDYSEKTITKGILLGPLKPMYLNFTSWGLYTYPICGLLFCIDNGFSPRFFWIR